MALRAEESAYLTNVTTEAIFVVLPLQLTVSRGYCLLLDRRVTASALAKIVSRSGNWRRNEHILLADTYSSNNVHTRHSHHPFVSIFRPQSRIYTLHSSGLSSSPTPCSVPWQPPQ